MGPKPSTTRGLCLPRHSHPAQGAQPRHTDQSWGSPEMFVEDDDPHTADWRHLRNRCEAGEGLAKALGVSENWPPGLGPSRGLEAGRVSDPELR